MTSLKLKRPILRSDCQALCHIAKHDDKTLTPMVLEYMMRQKRTNGILYEHEIDGVAHPIAFMVYTRRPAHRDILVNTIHCHLEYCGGELYPLLLGVLMRRLTPKYSSIAIEFNAKQAELVHAVQQMRFALRDTKTLNSGTFLEFSYGIGQ